MGTAGSTNVKESSLLYNEFIVYDVKQVLSKFVVQVDFEFQ